MSGVLERDVFLRAIEVLGERGWHQGGYAAAYNEGSEPTPESSLCLVAAVCVAMGLPVTDFDAHFAIADALGVSPIDWNDAPERTYEDVILALKRAAAGEVAP